MTCEKNIKTKKLSAMAKIDWNAANTANKVYIAW